MFLDIISEFLDFLSGETDLVLIGRIIFEQEFFGGGKLGVIDALTAQIDAVIPDARIRPTALKMLAAIRAYETHVPPPAKAALPAPVIAAPVAAAPVVPVPTPVVSTPAPSLTTVSTTP